MTFTTLVFALALGITLGELFQSLLLTSINYVIFKLTAKRRAAQEAAEKAEIEQFRNDLLIRAATIGAARQADEGTYAVN